MNKKTVKLPSGQDVEIKQPGILAMRAIAGQLPVVPRNESTPSEVPWTSQVDMAIKLVCACSLSPAYKEKPEAGEVSIDDLGIEDFNALAAAIMEFAGFTKAEESIGPLSEAKAT